MSRRWPTKPDACSASPPVRASPQDRARSAGETVEALKAQGAQRIAAVCYFIAPGLLCDTAIESAREAGVVHVGEPLGTAPELLDLIETRAAEA